jgi:hypothetical protein
MKNFGGICMGLGLLIAPSLATAASIPQQEDVCVSRGAGSGPQNKIVSKKKLAQFLRTNDRLSPAAEDDAAASEPKYGPERWRTVMADPKFCASGCSAEDQKRLSKLRRGFQDFLITGSESRSYSAADRTMAAEKYFVGADEENAIVCLGGKVLVEPDDPKPDDSNVRLRGNSDDLHVRRTSKDDFKAASKATLDFNSDRSESKKVTFNSKGSLGYSWPFASA